MKLLTFLRDGSERVGILTTRPSEGAEEAPREVVIDIARAVEVLDAQRKTGHLWWVTSWAGPWGEWTAPADMIDIARYGHASVQALEDLEKHLWNYARSSDGAWAACALVDPTEITWLPPIPEPPAFFFFHNICLSDLLCRRLLHNL